MTQKALKLLFKIQLKQAGWFVGIYVLAWAVIESVFRLLGIADMSWLPTTHIYGPKIYLLVMGVVYPLVATRLFISQGLTRKQFFWAYTGAVGIISLLLFIPMLASIMYNEHLSLSSVMIHFLHMPLFFLIGWTSAIGFQIGKWYTAALGVLSAVVLFHGMTSIPQFFNISNLALLGVVVVLLAILLLIMPRLFSRITLKA